MDNNPSNTKKATPASARKPTKRKTKDRPKRPLSAYNYFFKEERLQISKAVSCEDGTDAKDICPGLTPELISKLRKDGGKVSFSQMGKIIGFRWRDISDERLEYYKSLAEGDTERYKKDMVTFNQKKEEMRKNKNISPNMQFATHSDGHHMPPSVQRYPDVPVSRTYDQMGYMTTYQAEPNVSHGYGQPPGAYNSYYMPPHGTDGQFSSGAPHPSQASFNYSSYGHLSGSHPHNAPTPSTGSSSTQGEYYSSQPRSSEQYSYPQQAQSQASHPTAYHSSQQAYSSNHRDENW